MDMHHNNASPHFALFIRKFLTKYIILLFYHEPYSPDLVIETFLCSPTWSTQNFRYYSKCNPGTEQHPEKRVFEVFQ